MVLKISSTDGPDLNWPLVRSAGGAGKSEIIFQPRGLLAIALAGIAVALPALGALPHLLAMSEQLLGRRRRPSNVQWCARRLLGEEGIGGCGVGAVDRKLIFDVLDDSEPICQWQLIPRRHRRSAHAAGDGSQQVAVGGDRFLGQAELEGRRIEVSRPLLEEEGCGRSVAVALNAVAPDASPLVDLLAVRDPFARAGQSGLRDRQLLRLEHVAPLAAVHAKLLDIRQ